MDTSLEKKWMIYGANGYSGRLIAEHAVNKEPTPVLAGRNEAKVKAVADALCLPYRVFDLADRAAALKALHDIDCVVHAAGPFSETARSMREYCLDSSAHYVDITGEMDVLQATHKEGRRAARVGLCFMSGAGFDVIPTDCLALHLSNRMPDAEELVLAFTGDGSMSRGTARTVLKSSHEGGCIREAGKLKRVPLGHESRRIPFPCGERDAMCIPWGDVATAWESTGIANIKVFMGVPASQIRWVRWTRPIHHWAEWGWVQRWGESWIEKNVKGPTKAERNRLRSYLWGQVKNAAGETATATLVCPEGYRMTALGATEVAHRFLEGTIEPGAWTPAQAFGADFILDFPDTERKDL